MRALVESKNRLLSLAESVIEVSLNLGHARLIHRSGLFQGDDYRDRYALKGLWRSHPLLHYLLIGERKNYRPNAFFDPEFFHEAAGTRNFWKYLRDASLWGLPLSLHFDGKFYVNASTGVRSDPNPLRDFWLRGFGSNIDCSEAFSTRFFYRATSRGSGNKTSAAFWSLTSQGLLMTSPRQLEKQQDLFFSRIELKVLKKSEATQRRNLVFVQSGADYKTNLHVEHRSFDILLNYYEPCSCIQQQCEVVTQQRGTKVTAVRKLLEAMPEILLRYDYVLFLDDDVAISPEAIEKLFDVMERENIDIAQPALSENSVTYFEDLKQPRVGPGVRYLSAVEIMMPALSKRALERCGWAFSAGISGWAVDLLLSAKVQAAFATRAAVVGACVAEHLRPYDTENGRFYRFLQDNGIDANVEAGAIALRYGIDDSETAIRFVD